MIEVGDTVRLARKRERTGYNTGRGRPWATVDVPRDQQKVGLVIKDANNGACQMTVLVNGKVKFWFRKNVEKV